MVSGPRKGHEIVEGSKIVGEGTCKKGHQLHCSRTYRSVWAWEALNSCEGEPGSSSTIFSPCLRSLFTDNVYWPAWSCPFASVPKLVLIVDLMSRARYEWNDNTCLPAEISGSSGTATSSLLMTLPNFRFGSSQPYRRRSRGHLGFGPYSAYISGFQQHIHVHHCF